MIVLETFINWLLVVLLIMIGILPLFADIREPHKTKENKKVFTKMGKWFIAILFSTGLVAWGKSSMDAISHHNDEIFKNGLQTTVTNLSVAHTEDSMQQIIKDANCKREAELSAANYQLALDKARESIKGTVESTAKKTNDKIDSNKLTPDLSILSSNQNGYIETLKDNPTCNFVLGISNGGNGRANNVKFIYRVICSVKEEYRGNEKYKILLEENLFNNKRKEEVEVGHYLANGGFFISDPQFNFDTVYFIIHVYYTSYSKLNFNIDKVFALITKNGRFTEYNGGFMDFDAFIEKHKKEFPY